LRTAFAVLELGERKTWPGRNCSDGHDTVFWAYGPCWMCGGPGQNGRPTWRNSADSPIYQDGDL
jgi:hypothetical protein